MDVTVIGAGPAGSACATLLHRENPRLSICLLERTQFFEPRPGEVLPSEALPLLRRLGYPVRTLLEMGMPCFAVTSSWGKAQTVERHLLFSAAGHGYHIQRHLFDASLCAHAESCGVFVLRGTQIQDGVREGEGWNLLLSEGSRLRTRFIVDATGRACAFARALGIRRRQLDGLMSYSCYLPAQHAESTTMVEAVPQGWWYSAPLPSQRCVISFLTDVDLARDMSLPAASVWCSLLQQTTHIRRHTDLDPATPHIVVRPANTALLEQPGGEGWLATGDALASSDPLAAQGMTKALHSGILAAYAVRDVLDGKGWMAFERYTGIMAQNLESFARMYKIHYAREQRWPMSPFWHRRHESWMQEAI